MTTDCRQRRMPGRAGALRVIAAGAVLGVLPAMSGLAQTPIDYGPHRLSRFADTATLSYYRTGRSPPIPLILRINATVTPVPFDERFLVGFSPDYHLANLGGACDTIPCGAGCPIPEGFETLDFGFTAGFPFEGPGVDAVVYDHHGSNDDYTLVVRPRGGAFTTHRRYPRATQLLADPVRRNRAIPVDFEDFGLDPGTEVDTIRVLADCDIDPWVEYDPVMAAAIDRSCETLADCAAPPPCMTGACSSGTCSWSVLPRGTSCPGGFCDGAPRPSCRECLSDGDCRGERPRCHEATGTCVACLDVEDCRALAPECVEPSCEEHVCRFETPAPAGRPCSGGVCRGGPPEPLCVACLEDDDCAPETPYCDVLNDRCIACRDDQDCTSDDPCLDARCSLWKMCERFPSGRCADAGLPDLAEAPADDAGSHDDVGPAETGPATDDGAVEPSEGCGCRSGGGSRGSGPTASGFLVLVLLADLRRRLRLGVAASRSG
jgi:hypothetical protein